MKKIKSGLCIIFSAGMILSLSACQTEPKNMDSSNNILNSEEETVITEIYTTFGQPVETVFEITKNELMELAWWDENCDKKTVLELKIFIRALSLTVKSRMANITGYFVL